MRPRRIRAHPVVEIEEHRRALRGRAEQVAKPAQHARTNRVALVFGEQKAIGALARVDVEMVEPEIGQHFLELPLAICRAQNLLLAELDHDQIGLLLHGIGRLRRCRVGVFGVLLTVAPRLEHRQLELLGNFARAHADRGQAGQPRLHRRVRKALGMELLVDISLYPHRPDLSDIPEARAEPDAVQDVDNRLVVIGQGTGRY
jgi:hypothetical protein